MAPMRVLTMNVQGLEGAPERQGVLNGLVRELRPDVVSLQEVASPAHLAGDGPGHTWTVDNPAATAEIDAVVRQPQHRRRLDYVLVGSWHAHPHARAEARSAALVPADPTVEASDHFGVVVDLDLAGPSV